MGYLMMEVGEAVTLALVFWLWGYVIGRKHGYRSAMRPTRHWFGR